MSDCSVSAKIAGVIFTKDIQGETLSGTLNAEVLVRKLESTLKGTSFDPLAMAHVIQGAMLMSLPTARKMVTLKNIADIESFITKNSIKDPEVIASRMAVLASMEGYSNFYDIYNSLTNLSATNNTEVAPKVDNFTSIVQTVNESGILVDPDLIIIETLTTDNTSTEMLKRKSARMLKSKNLKENASDFWIPFLSTYFPGMSGVGSEFMEFTRKIFYAKLIDNTSSERGFMEDINSGLNEVKKAIENEVAASTVKYSEEDTTLNSAVLNGNEAIKNKYFNEVLATDFDFILNNLIKAVNVSHKDMKSQNQMVSGFIGEDNEIINPKPFNIKGLPLLFKKGEKNKYSLNELDAKGNVIPNVINIVDIDTLAFRADAELKENAALENNSFYFTSVDEKYYFKDQNGVITDITPISYYSYNSSSKRNADSFDPFVGALDSDSSFIHNLFPMLRIAKKNADNKLEFGERMTVIDFLTVAPHLTNAGKNLNTFIKSLRELSNQESEAGRIAGSLMVHVFSKDATLMADGTFVHSIHRAARKKGVVHTTINHSIVKALHNALINKDNVRYMKVDDGVTTVTRGIDSSSTTATVNTEIAAVMMTDGYTKETIASALDVLAGGDVTVSISSQGGVPVSIFKIDTITKAHNVAMALGMSSFFDNMLRRFQSSMPLEKAQYEALNTFSKLLYVAAVNKKVSPLEATENEITNAFKHLDYIRMSATTMISGDALTVLGSMFNVDSHKSITVGGVKTGSTSTPNRDSSMPQQVLKYNHFNTKVHPGRFYFNPFLDSHNKLIPHAKFEGTVLKTPMVNLGNAIKLSSWDERVRIEHAIIQGFLKAPKNVGTEFYIQPVNYSDKSNIQMHKVVTELNMLGASEDIKDQLIAGYIAYQAQKNEDLQRITISHLKSFILSNYSSLYLTASNSLDREVRTTALSALREELLKDYSELQGDMTRPLNALLADIKIHPDVVSYSDSEMDRGADFVAFDGNPNTMLLKPHLGVRAELYRNPIKAEAEVQSALMRNRQSMVDKKVNATKIQAALKENKGVVTNVDEFHDRFYLIHGIYGHALKTLTMGDESYFSAKYRKGESIKGYYSKIDSGVTSGLEEVESMLVGQFKRAQSELTRGNAYSQKITIAGIKKEFGSDNLLSYLDIYGDNEISVDNSGKRIMAGNSYEFENLEGRTLAELEGLGVISRFDDGNLISKFGTDTFVKFNVGTTNVFASTSEGTEPALKALGLDAGLTDGIAKLLRASLALSLSSEVEQQTQELSSVSQGEISTQGIVDVMSRENAFTMENYIDAIVEIRDNNMIVLPDLIPSFTISDPTTYVNLLNSMGNTQENSDAIQFMHPVMSLIMSEARGGVLGAFNTENQEALKLLTTTFEYGKMRQILQKKSVQMPFTTEQMRKLGSVELYNTFKKMNTSIKFKQPIMRLERVVENRDAEDEVFEANNMEELHQAVMRNLNNSVGHEVSDDVVWGKVLEILRQNPVNMYSFVGLITVPSNQKTGHKKLNKYDSVFSKKVNKDKPNIDYMANEYNYEVLTKAHSYDISGELHEASSLTLLSQLVNAVSFGGLSNLTSKNLQNAMGGRMTINSLRIGRDLANVAIKFQALPEETNKTRFNRVIQRLSEGNVSTKDFTGPEKAAYDTVLRAGVYEMANLAFQKTDSLLIHKIIKGEKLTTDEATGTVTIEGSVYSMDSPAVRAKVMGTLRSAFFQDTVKMKMSGFIGTVSATHKTINIFTLPNGKRVGRSGFIKGILDEGRSEATEPHRVIISRANIDEVNEQVLPFDDVIVINNSVKGKRSETIMRYGAVTDEMINSPDILVVGVLTPDVLYSDDLDADRYEKLDENALVKITNPLGKTQVFFKWYFDENFSRDDINLKIAAGLLKEDITERHSLRWYEYTKNNKTYDLKSSDAYRNFYRASLDGNVSEKEMDAKRALLILETQGKDTEGNNVYSVTRPEVVLPTYMANAFGLEKGQSVADIIGTDGLDEKNAQAYFDNKPKIGTRFMTLNGGIVHYSTRVKRIYSRKLVLENNTFDQQVLDYLNEFENSNTISPKGIKAINEIIESSRKKHVLGMAKDFISTLEVALTRIPGQSKQSGFMGNVVEFLDAQGNATFAPTEHLVNTGGDMDIDTLSVLTKTIDANGRSFNFKRFITDDTGFNVENMKKAYSKDILDSEIRIKKLIAGSNKQSMDLVDIRQEKVDSLNAQYPIESRSAEAAVLIRSAVTKLERAKKTLIQPEKIESLIRQSTKKIHASYENLLSNAIADGVFRALDDVDTAVELNTPISMGMFDSIIARIEKYEERVRSLKSAATVNKSKSWNELKTMEIFSEEGVNVRKAPKNKKDFEHFGNPFTATGVAGLIHVGKVLMTAEESKDPANKEQLALNTAIASDMYKKWLMSSGEPEVFLDINGRTQNLGKIAIEQRKWVKEQIAEGNLDGKVLLDVSESADMPSYVDVLANFVTTRLVKTRSGEDFKVIFEYENLAAQGKEAIGIFATVLKINSAVQAAKINYDTNYKNSDRKSFENPFFFKSGIEYTDFETGAFKTSTRSGFADLDRFTISKNVSESTELQKTIAKLVLANGNVDDSVKTLVNILSAEMKDNLDVANYGLGSEEAEDMITSLAKSLYDIDLPAGTLKGKDHLKMFAKYLNLPANKALVGKAFVEVIGKQLSNDAQSQFLSAATDNAKELILGKIRSNQLTNPIMTAMMLLGYDTKSTIDFLYDEDITKVLEVMEIKVGNLERVSINAKTLKAAGIDTNTGAVKSLIHLIEIGEEINKFRSVRSLNENAQIEQYKLDKILNDMDADVLYDAIVNDRIDKLVAKNEAQKVFNPNLMVFLHPQSRYLFKTLYESERYKMPSLFVSVKETSAIAGKSLNMNAFKNIGGYISKLQVESFFNRNSVTVDSKGVEKTTYSTGVVMTMQPDGTMLKKNVSLNQPANRGAFVKNFENYIEYAKEELHRLQGSENAALSNLGRDKTYNSTNAVYYFPKLKNSNIDSLETSLIHEGINELKIKTSNPELNKLQKEVYNNLSYYALIVSAGEIKKSSMIEAFEEINLSLAAHVSKITAADYKSVRPEIPFILDMVKGELKYEEDVIQGYLDNVASNDLSGGEGANFVEDPNISQDEEEPMGYTPDEFEANREYKADPSITRVHLGTDYTQGQAYMVPEWQLKGAVFYAHSKAAPAYRLFPSENSEALPNTTLPSSIDFSLVNKNVLKELAFQGIQIGYSSKYDNKPIRILAYVGIKGVPAVETYLIATETGAFEMAGVHLMTENPDLYLNGNIIAPIRSGNLKDADKKKVTNLTIVATADKTLVSKNVAINIGIANLFTDEEVQGDYIISRESRVLSTDGGAFDVLNIKEASSVAKTPSYVRYLNSDKVVKSNQGSSRTLIPAIVTDINKSSGVTDPKVTSEMMYQVSEIINYMDVGAEAVFFGILKNVNFNKTAAKEIVGGIDILNHYLKPLKSVRQDGTQTIINGSYEIKSQTSKTSNITKVTIKRLKNNGGLVMDRTVDGYPDGVLVQINTKTEQATKNRVSKVWLSDDFKMKALERKLIQAPHKKINLGIEGQSVEVIVLRTTESEDGFEMFVKTTASGYDDSFKKIRAISNKDVNLDPSKFIYVSSKVYNIYLNTIEKDGAAFINPSCK